jgi:hypothetical protein
LSTAALTSALVALRVLDDVGQRLGHDAARAPLDLRRQPDVEPRELAHGIVPSVLTRGGLRAGVYSLVARLDVPVCPERSL